MVFSSILFHTGPVRQRKEISKNSGECAPQEKPNTERDHAVDCIKAFSIGCVLLIHVSAIGFASPVASGPWLSALLWNSLARAGVPLFFMCSGALFLDPERAVSVKTLFTRSIPRILAAMLLWPMAYKAFHLLANSTLSAPALWQGLTEVLLGQQEFHFYYLQILLLVYCFYPVLRLFTRCAAKRELEYGLTLWAVLGIIYPTLLAFRPFSALQGIPLQWKLNMSYSAMGYCLLGWYRKRYPTVHPRLDWLLLAVGFAIVFGGTLLLSLRRGELAQEFLEGMSPGVALMAAGIYGLFRRKPARNPCGLRFRLASALSSASFCIYLVHVFFLNLLAYRLLSLSGLPYLFSIPLAACCIGLCSCAVYVLLSKIPLVNRWLI